MAHKFTMLSRFQKVIGKPCAYCHRNMSVQIPGLMPTLDHVHPRSRGGQKTVWACDDCNQMKRDMSMLEWQRFMEKNPKWWERRARSSVGSEQRISNSQVVSSNLTEPPNA